MVAKAKKHQPLEVGQRVWLEIRSYRLWRGSGYYRSVFEVEVVRANRSSAYVVEVEDLNAEKAYERKISQKTLTGEAFGFGSTYHVWFSKESFEASVQRGIDTANARKEAHELVDKMNLTQLKQFLGGDLYD